jgi:hypothetical protein
MTNSWILPPSLGTTTENSSEPFELSPLSSAQIIEQRHPHHYHQLQQKISSSSLSAVKLSKCPHRHSRSYRHHHHMIINSKRKRLSEIESTNVVKDELHPELTEETSMITSSEQIKQEETNDNMEEQITSSNNNNNTLSSSFKINRDLLRKDISQHVHATLKPYTKRTCKQGHIVSTDHIKYLVKRFTLAVIDKEIEKAKNDGIS